MYKNSIYLTIALSILIAACGDTTSFTVDETKYRLDKHCPDIQINEKDYFKNHKGDLKYIAKEDCNPQNPNCIIDNNKHNFEYNFENNLCPTDFPKCIANTEPNNPGFHCEAEARKGCEKDGINYEHNDSICENETVQKGKVSTCNNGTWDTAQCETSCNPEGNGCGECVNDEEKYVNDDSNNQSICKHAKCVNGSFDFDHAAECTEHVSCKLENGERKCGECINGKVRCENDDTISKLMTCADGVWKQTTCPDNTRCHIFGTIAECNSCSKENQYRCDNDENNNCVIKICKDNIWQPTVELSQSGNSCLPNKTDCGECHNDDIRCTENSQNIGTEQKCINGQWINTMTCMLDANKTTKCRDSQSCDKCSNDEIIYINNPDNFICTAMICKDNRWQELKQCNKNGSQVSCDFRITDSEMPCGECINNTRRCDPVSDTPQICQDGAWTSDGTCPDTVSCISATGTCGKCKNGETKYENTLDEDSNLICRFQVCSDGQWQEVHSGNEQFSEYVCPDKVSCMPEENSGLFKCGDCLNNTQKCTNDANNHGTVEHCIDGRWILPITCNQNDVYISCNQNKCGECLIGNTKIENNAEGLCRKFICNQNAQWEEIPDTSCQYSCSDKTGTDTIACGECINGKSQCINDNNNKGTMEICSDGSWKQPTSCNGASCQYSNENSECGVCKNNDDRYIENKDGVCIREVCKDGIWEPDTQNNSPKVSCNSKLDGFGNCLNGTTHCEDKTLVSCVKGEEIKVDCPDACENNKCTDATCNDNYKTKCENGYIFECKNDIITVSACSKFAKCMDDSDKCADCLSNICNNDKNGIGEEQRCNKGVLSPKETCKNVSCNLNECGECKNGANRCETKDGQTIQYLCKDGVWKEQMNCGIFSCNGNKCGECKENDNHCQMDEDAKASIQTCQKGRWSDPAYCTSDNKYFSCKSETECGTCLNDSYQCISSTEDQSINIINKCKNGVWVYDESCGTNSCSMNGSTITCGKCKDGSVKFEDQIDGSCLKYTCNNGLWSEDSRCRNNYSCKKENDQNVCGDCLNYTFSKDGMNAKHCFNGEWGDHYCGWGPTQKGEYYLCYLIFGYSSSPIKCYNEFDSGKNQYIGKITKNNQPCSDPDASCRVTGHNASECGECLDYTTRCVDSKQQQTCVNGTWAFPETCENGCANDKCK